MFSSELNLLALYGLVVVAVIVIQVLIALPAVGLPYLVTPRDEKRDLGIAGGRALRCLENSVVALALFAPAVLILAVKGISTSTTLLAAQAFVIARILYVPIYLGGIPWLRTLVWTVGVLAIVALYFAALGDPVAGNG